MKRWLLVPAAIFALSSCAQEETVEVARPTVHVESGVPIVPLPGGLRFAQQRVRSGVISGVPVRSQFDPGVAFVERVFENTSPTLAGTTLPRVVLTSGIGQAGLDHSHIGEVASGLLALNADWVGTEHEDLLVEALVYTMAMRFAHIADVKGVDFTRWAEASRREAPYRTGPIPESYDTVPSLDAMAYGFRSDHGPRSQYQDLGEIVYGLLMGESILWEGYRNHAIFRDKVDLAIQFLEAFDSTLTRDFFLDRRETPLVEKMGR